MQKINANHYPSEDMNLSIIVPIYNVERYVRACLESIFRQGLDEDDFEVIAVNDGSTDGSVGIVEDMLSDHPNITLVHQQNQGLSAARNTGIGKASGTYLLFLDSDDLLVDGTLPRLLAEAMKSHPDMLVADYVKMNDQEIAHHPTLSADCTFEATTGTELFLHSLNPRACYVWRALYSREFLDRAQLRFIPGIFFEDVPFTTACYLKAETCIRSTCVFYIYRQRPASICSSIDIRKIFDLNTVVALLEDIRTSLPAHEVMLRRQTENIMFSTFSIAVWYTINDRQLYEQRKEIVSDLRKKVPYLDFSNGTKQRMVSIVFRAMPLSYLALRRLFRR